MANTIVWFEIPVRNLESATNFYSKVLNKPLQITTEHGFKMTIFPHEDCDVGGCLYEEQNANAHSGLLVYFDVNTRIHDAVDEAVKHGGKLVEDITPIGPWGFRAIVLDCCGNKVALHAKVEK